MARFCTTCGSPLDDEAAFCTNCGTPVEAVQDTQFDETAVLENPVEDVASVQVTETFSLEPEPTAAIPSADSYAAQASQQAAQSAPQQVAQQTSQQAPQIQTPVIQAPVGAAPLGQAPQKSNTPIIIGIVIAVVVIIAAVLVGMFVFGEQKSETTQQPSTPAASTTTNATCTVTFQMNGGPSINSVTVEQGGMLTSPLTPTREGYTFDGWYLDSGLTRSATFPMKIESDTTLYAKWDDNRLAKDVTVTIVGRDGTTRTATIHRDGMTGRVFPNSNTQPLSESEVRALSDAERCIAWNEIIAAANGYEFKNSGLRDYFTNDCEWYKPNPSSNGTSNLSSTANKNIEMLKRYTDSWWLSLATN